MVHDLSNNAATLDALGMALAEFTHAYSYDQRAHGQTPAELSDRDELFADVGAVSDALGLRAPMLVGEGYGAWVVASAVLSGYVRASALILLSGSGFTLPRAESTVNLELLTEPTFIEMMAERFGWGVCGSEFDRVAHIDDVLARGARDWLHAGVDTGARRRVVSRSIVSEPGGFRHRPSLEQMRAAARLTDDMSPYPCAQSFAQLRVPVLLVEGHELVSGRDLESAHAFVAGAANRRLEILEQPAYVSRSASRSVAVAIRAFLQEQVALR